MSFSTGLTMAQLLVGGLAIGAIYALIALGFVLIYNALGLVSFAQGEFVMVAALVGLSILLLPQFHPFGVSLPAMPVPVAYAAVLLLMVLFGLVFSLICYRPLRRRGWMPFLISTIGFSILAKNGAQLVWGSAPQTFPSPFARSVVAFGRLQVRTQDLFILATTGLMLLALWLLFDRTLVGKQMLAVAQDRATARLLGVKVERLVTLTFVLSSVLAGVAGLLVAPVFTVSKDMGGLLALKAFAATIVGGFGSLRGSVVGGLLIGVSETFGAFYVSLEYSDAIAFLILIGVLLCRPQGLFGESSSEKV